MVISKIRNKSSKIQRSWNSTEILSKRLSLPNIDKCLHLQPYRLMEFRDDQGVRRFFRMENHAIKADIDTLKFIRSKLDPEVEEEAFIKSLHRFINIKLDIQGRKRRSEKSEEIERKK